MGPIPDMNAQPAESIAEQPERFASRKTAWEWVVANGGTVSRGKFYADADKGLYRVYPDKTVSRTSVLEYLLKIKGQQPAPNLDLVDYSQERQRLELEKLRIEVKKLHIANRAADRNWVHVDDHWAHLSASLSLCKGNLEHFARMHSQEIVAEAGGDYHLAPQVADRLMDLVINRAFNELSLQKLEHGRLRDEAETSPDEEEDPGVGPGSGAIPGERE